MFRDDPYLFKRKPNVEETVPFMKGFEAAQSGIYKKSDNPYYDEYSAALWTAGWHFYFYKWY